jgi:hypothetical protein
MGCLQNQWAHDSMSPSQFLRLTPCLLLAACATPRYCAPMLERNRAIMSEKSDETVAWIVTALSQIKFAGTPCICPQDVDSAGHRCGDRSAHSRPGGVNVYCSAAEVPPYLLSKARDYGATLALPPECGGAGDHQVLNYGE